MRLLADENIHGAIVAGLRAAGHDVAWIAETNPGSLDEDVLALARLEKRILLTFDRDFGALVDQGNYAPGSGVIYLRLPRTAVKFALQRLGAVLASDDALEGTLVVIAPARIRRKKLARKA